MPSHMVGMIMCGQSSHNFHRIFVGNSFDAGNIPIRIYYDTLPFFPVPDKINEVFHLLSPNIFLGNISTSQELAKIQFLRHKNLGSSHLWIQSIQSTSKRDRFTHMMKPTNPGYSALDAQTKSRVRYRPIPP